MEPIIIASLRALRSVFARGMFGVFIRSVLITVFALITFVIMAGWFFGWVSTQLEEYLWATALPWVGTIGSSLLAWFLFPTIMPVIVNFFDDKIANLIESQDYPALKAKNPTPFWQELGHDARFTSLAIALNILILPFYLLMPGLHFLPFYLLNGYLLGREFFTMVAKRHVSVAEAEALRQRYSRSIMAAGISLAIFATIPFVNLLAPFWGIAVMVHLYQLLSEAARIPPVIDQPK